MYIFTIFKPFGLENCVNAYRRGLLRCSFGLQGNAKASNRGTSDRTDSRAFFFIQSIVILFRHLESWQLKKEISMHGWIDDSNVQCIGIYCNTLCNDIYIEKIDNMADSQ